MEDVLTEIPPPSRFFQEDLDNFSEPPDPLPSPFFVFSDSHQESPLRPSLLIIALSSPSLHILHDLPSKTLIGSLIIPEIPFSGNSLEPSLGDKSCNIYSINGANGLSILLVSVQLPVSPERSHAVTRLLIGQEIAPEKVIIFDSIQSRNFRSRISSDMTCAYKLETSQRKSADEGNKNSLMADLEYYPSGSMIDGLSAAVLSRCQMKNIKGTLIVSWPESGPSATRLVGALLTAMSGLDSTRADEELEEYSNSSRISHGKDLWLEYDLYA